MTTQQLRVRVWDLPTRMVHWLIAALVAFSWWTGNYGEAVWHRRSGYAIMILVLFRIYWGFFGGTTARFVAFVRSPDKVWRHARQLLDGSDPVVAGHTPTGGWSVLAMLIMLAVQASLGLFAVDIDGLESGPLSYLVSFETGRAIAEAHEAAFNLLLALIVLHVAAVLFYLICKRVNLITPMIDGCKMLSRPGDFELRSASIWRALAGLAAAALIVAALAFGLRF